MVRRLLAGCMAFLSMAAAAQSYPAKPVRLVIPFAAGGPTDIVARLFGEKLAPMWGQPLVVDNRPGGGGTLGTALVAKSAPDGYTLVLAATSHVYNDLLIGNLPYDPIKDFTPIAMMVSFPSILVVHPSVPANNLRQLVGYAKANPGKLSFGSAGIGTLSHLSAELFRRAANIDLLVVHYKGAAPATTDLLGGRLHGIFNNPLSSLPLIKSGQVRALAATGENRSPSTPDLPTVAESGYAGFKSDNWFALVGPAGLPREIVRKLAKDVAAVLDMPDVRQQFADRGLEATGSTPEQLAAVMRSDQEKYAALFRDANIKAN
jgi:tripartite-type tricarboxylate transporter receptor subunit TctC